MSNFKESHLDDPYKFMFESILLDTNQITEKETNLQTCCYL